MTQVPTIGRVVIYRSRLGHYSVPAVVTATQETLWPEGVERGDVPALSSPLHVHLHVLTPGRKSSYAEHDVPLDESGETPGSWSWPVMRGVAGTGRSQDELRGTAR